jgi:hypothetical protein
VIKVPLADPAEGCHRQPPRIFEGLTAPAHATRPAPSTSPRDRFRRGQIIEQMVLPTVRPHLAQLIVRRAVAPARRIGGQRPLRRHSPMQIWAAPVRAPARAPTSATTSRLPAIGLAGGACEGYGLLLDISDPVNPVRIDAVADSNFAYWHSATFSNDGSKILFTDEWGGGGAPKCRATDPYEWGANAIFTIENRKLVFQSYYKIPPPDEPGELRRAQRLADPGARPRHHGAVLVPGWHLGLRLDRREEPQRDRVHDRGPVDATRWRWAAPGPRTGTTA